MNKLALVGHGAWGKNYLPFIQPEYVKTKNYKDLFNQKGVTAVIIATPTQTHFQIAKEFIKRGFNLLIEKPITQTFNEALALQRLSKKFKVKVMAGHILLYDEAFIFFKKTIKKIGKIKKIKFTGLKSPRRKGSTLLQDWMPHPIYIFLDITKSYPKTLHAKYAKGVLSANFSFKNDITASASVAWKYPNKKRLLEMVGQKGRVILNYKDSPKKIILKQNGKPQKTYSIKERKSALENQINAFERHQPNMNSAVHVMKILDELSRQLKI